MNVNSFTIRQASADDAHSVGLLVNALLCELAPESHSSNEMPKHIKVARSLLSAGHMYAFLAVNCSNTSVGICTLHQSAAVYANGVFGEISELYIIPEYRSDGLGADMIKTAKNFGRKQGWAILEVGAPNVPRWQRTVNFYLAQGFSEVGPRLSIDITTG